MMSITTESHTLLLLVEDDPWMQSIVGNLLTDEGYIVLRASSAAEALRAARRQRLSVILLDLNLPGVPGLELLRWLKSHAATADIPVIALSGDRQLLDDCAAGGTYGTFEKPFDFHELIEAVAGAVGSPPQREPVLADS